MSFVHTTTLVLLLGGAGTLILLVPNSSRPRVRRLRGADTSGTVWWGFRRIRRTMPGWGSRISRRRRRESDLLRLAVTWDLMAAALRSGMPVSAAVCAAADSAPATVRGVLVCTADLLALGADPADAWRQASECPETAELARTACRTARSGTALATALTQLADGVRAGARDAARARAQRAGVLLTGPLGLCFLPAFLCLGVIPVVLGLANQLSVLR